MINPAHISGDWDRIQTFDINLFGILGRDSSVNRFPPPPPPPPPLHTHKDIQTKQKENKKKKRKQASDGGEREIEGEIW